MTTLPPLSRAVKAIVATGHWQLLRSHPVFIACNAGTHGWASIDKESGHKRNGFCVLKLVHSVGIAHSDKQCKSVWHSGLQEGKRKLCFTGQAITGGCSDRDGGNNERTQ